MGSVGVAITNHRSRREDFDALMEAVSQIGPRTAEALAPSARF